MQRRRFSLIIEISAGRSAGAIYSALRPDVTSSPESQVSALIRLDEDGGRVWLDLSSDDLSHLRAGLNSYLRLARAALSCLDVTTL